MNLSLSLHGALRNLNLPMISTCLPLLPISRQKQRNFSGLRSVSTADVARCPSLWTTIPVERRPLTYCCICTSVDFLFHSEQHDRNSAVSVQLLWKRQVDCLRSVLHICYVSNSLHGSQMILQMANVSKALIQSQKHFGVA